MLAPDVPQQAIVVTASGWDSQRAVTRRFERDADGWTQVGRPVPAWLGRGGLAPASRRLQNTGTTPAGVFDLPQAFGQGSGKAVALPYQRITNTTYWPYDPRDPRTYNVLQTTRVATAKWRDDGEWSERLAAYGRAYRYAAVIGYNLPRNSFAAPNGEHRTSEPANTAKGGGIFLHVSQGRPTAGCVSLPIKAMRKTLRWLQPTSEPVIVIGPPAITRDWRQAVRARR